jgi:hypothetical protein
MKNALLAAMQQTPTARTWNGDVAHSTTWDKGLDLFGAIGSLRKDQGRALNLFKTAYDSNVDLAVRIALWARDVRGGAGERESFKTILKWLGEHKADVAIQLVPMVAEVGRWDDLFVLLSTGAKEAVIHELAKALMEGNGLCAKWMPRKGPVAAQLRTEFGMSPKQYRKLIVSLTHVVETAMCAKDWTSIEFGKLPSLASARYQKAFERNAPSQYAEYVKALEKGEAKINASAIFPHDVVMSAKNGNDTVASAQWKALPNYMEGTNEKVLAMVDVSESMSCGINGGSMYAATSGVSCMDVAIALGIYCSERNEGPFKDHIVTFTRSPKLLNVGGSSLKARAAAARKDVGYDTNFDAAYRMILDAAVGANVPAEDMPTMLLVLSDMQFNPSSWNYNKTANERLKAAYQAAGYTVPKMVYWNLNAASGNQPITMHDKNCALVSGFSPSILKSVLNAKEFDPASIMHETVMVERYNWQGTPPAAE